MNIDERKKLTRGNAEPSVRDKNEGLRRGGEGKTRVTTAWPVKKVAEGKQTSYEFELDKKTDDLYRSITKEANN